MLCIICALTTEYINIINKLCVSREIVIQENIHICESDIIKCIVAKCDIGKYAAAKCLNEILNTYSNVSVVFSVGIAGAISPLLKVGNIIVGNTIIDYNAQMKAEIIRSKWDITRYFKMEPAVCWGKIISSDMPIQNEYLKKQLFCNYHAACVEMESASIVRLCNEKRIKFAAIKVISDYADESLNKVSIRTQLQVSDKLGIYIYNILPAFCDEKTNPST